MTSSSTLTSTLEPRHDANDGRASAPAGAGPGPGRRAASAVLGHRPVGVDEDAHFALDADHTGRHGLYRDRVVGAHHAGRRFEPGPLGVGRQASSAHHHPVGIRAWACWRSKYLACSWSPTSTRAA